MVNHRLAARSALCALVLLLLAAAPAHAQHDTKGREFWATFLANFGSGDDSERSDLRLYVSSDRPTSIEVIYWANVADTFRLVLDQPFTTYTIDINQLYGNDVELLSGVSRSRQSFRIVAKDDITLYGVNIRSKSADAFLGLPEDVLTRSYIVLAYPNGWAGDLFDMPSQFAVIATQDGTTVRIAPSPGTTINNTHATPFTVMLDRGDVYFAQAGLESMQDVSGTEIVSNKPVAVFAGNRRTSIPTNVGNYRDHLVEQMPPLEVWGKEAILTPHFPITPSSTAIYPAVARVLAAFDDTQWTLDGQAMPPLARGVSREIMLTRPMLLSASGPIMVAQYEHSVGESNGPGGDFSLGDPFMMLIPPSEQFDTAYSFQSVVHPEFVRHYMNIVVPTAATATMELDGELLSDRGVQFNPVPLTTYSYAQVELNAGSHFIRGSQNFGLYVYGFGAANSYGYTGGMLFRKLVHDFQPPEIADSILCGIVNGFAFDTRIADTGIDSLYMAPGESNVRVTIDPFVSPADTIRFRVELIDPYLSGFVSMIAIDSGGRSHQEDIRIPGFTLRATAMTGNAPARYDTLIGYNGVKYCRSVMIENYGGSPQTISRIDVESILGSAVELLAELPMTLLPGEKREISICSAGMLDTTVDATIHLFSDCGSRTVAIVPVVGRIDTTAPSLLQQQTPCGDDVTITFSEGTGSGIQEFTLIDSINCIVTSTPAGSVYPTSSLEVTLHRRDPRQDMIYEVRLVDRVGNSIVHRDTIGGFTVAAVDYAGDTVGIRYDRTLASDSITVQVNRCDSIVLSNYGSRPLPVSNIRMRGNISFSIPPAQLPLVIPPHGRRVVQLCIQGLGDTTMIDTVVISNGCGLLEEVRVTAEVVILRGTGADICNNAISVEQHAPSKRTFLQPPVPNPAAGAVASVDIGMATDDVVAFEIYQSNGEPALTVLRSVRLEAGLNRVTFDISGLDAGVYLCRLVTATGGQFVQKMVVGR